MKIFRGKMASDRRILFVLMMVFFVFAGKVIADGDCAECKREQHPSVGATIFADNKTSMESLSSNLAAGRFRNVVVMCGEGCSASANLTDFNELLIKHNIWDWEFRSRPRRFFSKVRNAIPFENPSPTKTHRFLKLLHDKKMLKRVYTQNADGLELLVGLPENMVVQTQGTYLKSYCMNETCGETFDYAWLKKELFCLGDVNEVPQFHKCLRCQSIPKCPKCPNVPNCPSCQEVVRPAVRFFGEPFPDSFYDNRKDDFESCDLLLVLGTALYHDDRFDSLVKRPALGTPRLYVHSVAMYELPFLIRKLHEAIDWFFGVRITCTFKEMYDLEVVADCDETISKICDLANWTEELDAIGLNVLDSARSITNKY